MTRPDLTTLSFDEMDELRDPRPDVQGFDHVVERALSRRGFLNGALAFGSAAAVMGLGGLASTTSARAQAAGRFAFAPIPIATDGTVHVPAGYRWDVVAKWGQPLFPDAPDFDHETGGTAASSERAFGDNNDGMEMFSIDGHTLIAVNNEYTNPEYLHPKNPDGVPANAEDVRKTQNVQGVSVIEVAEGADGWSVVVGSPFTRRITNTTPMRLSGPAAGHDLLKTAADPSGTTVLGTLNNCGAGKTPWGTYLTCEENFNGYFGASNPDHGFTDTDKRYGLGAESGYGYEKFDPRFDITQNPNEPHRFGWVVEIDPANPASTPVKRTALGRFKHENAAVVLAPDGRVVVYMGDDERGEFLYKFVSSRPYAPGTDTGTLLDEGQLYVAKFNDDQSGEWLPLTPESTGMTMAEMLIFARVAASRVGATTMDRPEWVAVNPIKAEAYCALTNNKNRGVKPNAGGDTTPVGGPNPRAKNLYGQVVRWAPVGDDHAATGFKWDLYVMAGNPTVHNDAYAGSANITEGNMFNSPDGMMFDSAGMLWIQTDGEDDNAGDFKGHGNNQMLVGDPVTGQIARFLTGPKGCEVTGITWAPDRRTVFVGIQHPGAPFPDGEGKLPRSSIIAISREDGAVFG
ncbi:secreted PhoX family phosphatase [Rhodobacteraceae bacterium MBR-64]